MLWTLNSPILGSNPFPPFLPLSSMSPTDAPPSHPMRLPLALHLTPLLHWHPFVTFSTRVQLSANHTLLPISTHHLPSFVLPRLSQLSIPTVPSPTIISLKKGPGPETKLIHVLQGCCLTQLLQHSVFNKTIDYSFDGYNYILSFHILSVDT